MQSGNYSNFTYADAPLRATSVQQPYNSLVPGSVTQSNMPVSSTHYSLAQPVTVQTGAPTTYLSPQTRVITNQTVEPIRVSIF
jgi:hypothetical protein